MFTREWDHLVMSNKQKAVEEGAEETEVMIGKVKRTAGEFTKRSSLLPFILLLTIFLFQQLSGTYPIIFYAVQVFQSIGSNFGPGLNADSATVILGIIRFVTSLITAGLSRSYGRRPLFIMSSTGMALSGFIAAVYFQRSCSFSSAFNQSIILVSNTSSVLYSTNYTASVDKINSTLSPPGDDSDVFSNFIGLACILMFVTMSSLGVLIIPWTLIGEILPMSVRGIGGGLMCSFAYILMFGIVKVFPFMLDIFSISGLFYFFSFTSFLNVVVVYFFLPETLGKSFEEIEKSFMRTPVIGLK